MNITPEFARAQAAELNRMEATGDVRTVADNVAHQLYTLADLMEGYSRAVAGVHCARCGSPLKDSGSYCVPLDNRDPWEHDSETPVHELLCLGCFAEGGEAFTPNDEEEP